MSDTDYALRRETEVARQLVASLKQAGDTDDEEIVHTAIEGETCWKLFKPSSTRSIWKRRW